MKTLTEKIVRKEVIGSADDFLFVPDVKDTIQELKDNIPEEYTELFKLIDKLVGPDLI